VIGVLFGWTLLDGGKIIYDCERSTLPLPIMLTPHNKKSENFFL
jgi:hypothetical protein